MTILFLIAFVLTSRGPTPRTTGRSCSSSPSCSSTCSASSTSRRSRGSTSSTKGTVKFVLHFLFLAAAVTYLARRGEGFFWRALGWFTAGMVANAVYGVLQLLAARAGHNLDSTVLSPLTGGASSINIYGAVNGQSVYRPNALTGDPNHLAIMLDVPLLALTPVYLRLRARPPLEVGRLAIAARVPLPARARDALAERHARARSSACSCSRCRTGACLVARVAACRSAAVGSCSRTSSSWRSGPTSPVVMRVARRRPSGSRTRRTSPSTTSSRQVLTPASAARPRSQHLLGLLRVPDRSHGLGAAQLLRRADRRDRPDRDRGVRAVPDLAARAPCSAAPRGARARARRRSRRGARGTAGRRPARRVARHDGRERLLPDDAVLLLLRARRAAARAADRVRGTRPEARAALEAPASCPIGVRIA